MPNAFTNLAKVTRSHIPFANAPARMDVLNAPWSQPRKRKTTQTSNPSLNPTIAYLSVSTYEVILYYNDVLDETYHNPENREILVHYAMRFGIGMR
ncbi:hypothetical protein TB1_013682 [Malus domestica]